MILQPADYRKKKATFENRPEHWRRPSLCRVVLNCPSPLVFPSHPQFKTVGEAIGPFGPLKAKLDNMRVKNGMPSSRNRWSAPLCGD